MFHTDHKDAFRAPFVRAGLFVGLGWLRYWTILLFSFFVCSPACADGKLIVGSSIDDDGSDYHQLRAFYSYLSMGQISYSGALDVANVVWLGDELDGEQAQSPVIPWQAAEALRIRDWQLTGFGGGATAPTNTNLPNEITPGPQFDASPVVTHIDDVGVIYGIRVIERQKTDFTFFEGSILHDGHWETDAENYIVGPQLGLILTRRFGRLSTRLQATAMAGFNFGDVNQRITMGDGLVPGALNQPLYVRRTEFSYVDPHDELSPSGEVRAEARYRLTETLTLAITWSGIAIGNALLTDERTRYVLPDFGLVDPGDQTIFFNQLYCGVEMVL